MNVRQFLRGNIEESEALSGARACYIFRREVGTVCLKMPSRSFDLWNTQRRTALDQIATAHAAVGGLGRGRRYATQQINQAYAMLLSSQFQGFCRDLHSEAVDHICGPETSGDLRMLLLRMRCTTGRKLDSANPNPGNLGADFGFFNLKLWPALKTHNRANERRNTVLETLNDWRNAIAHQDFDPQKLGERTTVRLNDVLLWRRTCEHLAADMDFVVGAHVATIIGVDPW